MSLKKLTTPRTQTEPGIFFVKSRRGIQVFYLSSATRSLHGLERTASLLIPVDATDGYCSAENSNLTTAASRRWRNYYLPGWSRRMSLETNLNELVETGGDF
jgi:hypothetical protein